MPEQSKYYRGKQADPEFRRARARKAALARHSTDALIDSIVAKAPELTPEQVAKLRPLVDVAVQG